jgi:hypothetical protein
MVIGSPRNPLVYRAFLFLWAPSRTLLLTVGVSGHAFEPRQFVDPLAAAALLAMWTPSALDIWQKDRIFIKRPVHRLVLFTKFHSMSNTSVQLNEPVIRIVAFEVALLLIAFALTRQLVIPLFLLFDFYLRGWDMQRFSPLRWIAIQVNHYLLQNRFKPVFAPPKFFAAKIGAVLNFAIIIAVVIAPPYFSLGLAIVVIFFALLESLAGFCSGCYIYNYYQKVRHHLHF